MTMKPTTVPSKRLAASITAASSTIQLNNILGWDAANLAASDFGTRLFIVLRNDTNTLMEIMEVDPATIASASITILARGLQFDGNLSTEVTANKLSWVKNETIVELGSDVPQLLNQMVQITGAQTIAGVKTFSSLPDTTAGDAVSDNDLVRKAQLDAAALGQVGTDKVIVAGTAGETVADGDLIYFDTTDDEWKLCDADTAATVENVALGIAQGAGIDGGAITGGVLLQGVDDAQSGLTVGDIMYASNTAGGIANSAGTTEVTIGIAKSTTEVYFYSRFNQQLTQDQIDALAGTSGTPSTSNKFVTADETATYGNVKQATVNAGETINGATLPVAIYQKAADNEIYACDGDDTTALEFLGFAITNSTDGNPITIQTAGVVSGFTALVEGTRYYVQDDKTIGTSVGTYETLVGIAISTTELVILHGSFEYMGSEAVSDTGGSGAAATDTATMPADARFAICNLRAENNLTRGTGIEGEITIGRVGKTSGEIEVIEDSGSSERIMGLDASLSGNTITVTTLAQSGATVTLSGTVYFYK